MSAVSPKTSPHFWASPSGSGVSSKACVNRPGADLSRQSGPPHRQLPAGSWLVHRDDCPANVCRMEMACGNIGQVNVPDTADAQPIHAGSQGCHVVGLEDRHIATLAAPVDEPPRRRRVGRRHHDFEELIPDGEHGIDQAELAHAGIGKRLAEPQNALQCVGGCRDCLQQSQAGAGAVGSWGSS